MSLVRKKIFWHYMLGETDEISCVFNNSYVSGIKKKTTTKKTREKSHYIRQF